MKATHDPVPVKLITEETIGTASSARDAFEIIGFNWDHREYGPVNGHYEFELDDHRFLVHIVPLEPVRIPTPFDDHA